MMELSALKHIEPSKLSDFEADIFITSLGYESRSTSISRMLEHFRCRKIALVDSQLPKVLSYENNRSYFLDSGFEIMEVEGGSPDIGSILGQPRSDDMRLICDCTSMSQKWYYELFRWFSESQEDYGSATVRLTYTMAGYVEPGPPARVRRIKEFTGAENREGKNKKRAMLLGLSHEKNMSESIHRMIRPDLLYLFYADPPADKQFVEKLFINNHSLIDGTPIRNLVAYPIRNGQLIYQSLVETILPLRNEYTIHLVPQGPKIFSVASMLVHLSYPDTIISYPELKKSIPVDRQSFDEPVVLDIQFEGEE